MNVLQIVLFLSLIWNFNDTIVQLENVGATSAQFAAKPRCETVPWPQFRYQPPVKGGHPVKVKTEVEVRFEPRK
jgi:hypothetical protein